MYAGGALLVLSGYLFLVSLRKGVKAGDILTVPNTAVFSDLEKYIRPNRIFIVKATTHAGLFLFMSSILVFVARALFR